MPALRPVADGEEISIFAVGALLLRNRWRILRWAGAGAVVALAISWARPAMYRASASFIPQGADPGRSSLAGLAGQFGLTLGTGSPTLTPDFYLRLLTSREILSGVANDTFTVPELNGKRETMESLLDIHGGSAKMREDAAVDALKRRISASVSPTTGIVDFTVDTQWPSVSLAIANQLVQGVNDFNQRTRRDQASAERKFIEGRLAVATSDLRAAEDRLQAFLQGNRQFGSPQLQFEQDRLQRDVSLRQQVFSTLTQAYDDVRMREVRNTPVITIVDQPTVPAKPRSRGRAVSTILGFLVGAALGMLLVFFGDVLARRQAEGDAASGDFVAAVEQLKGGVFRRFGRRDRASA